MFRFSVFDYKEDFNSIINTLIEILLFLFYFVLRIFLYLYSHTYVNLANFEKWKLVIEFTSKTYGFKCKIHMLKDFIFIYLFGG